MCPSSPFVILSILVLSRVDIASDYHVPQRFGDSNPGFRRLAHRVPKKVATILQTIFAIRYIPMKLIVFPFKCD